MVLRSGRPGLLHGGAALLAWLGTVAVFWPGIILYDSVDQYRQVLTGDYEDWHPPVMARLWSLFASHLPGGAPMFLLQTGLYWLGLALLAVALARRGHRGAAWVATAIGAFFLASCWLGAVLKDSQMVGAMVAAAGIVGTYRLAGQRLAFWAAALVGFLLLYALLLRANAVFAVVPLAFLLFGWGRGRGPVVRLAVAVAAVAAAIGATPLINQHLLWAEPSGAEKSLLVYDLTGIANHGAESAAGIPSERWRKRICYRPLEWDRSGEAPCPGFDLINRTTPQLVSLWIHAVLRHPLAYAGHRLAHFNVTMRLFVPMGELRAVSPVDSEPNELGLGAPPGRMASMLHRIGVLLSELPPA